MTTEVFRPYPPEPGLYEVSDIGRIKSLPRVVMRSNGAPQTVKERILKPYPDRKGYLYHNLIVDGEKKRVYVHQAVALTFIGPRPPGALCLHGDGDNQNNCASNLRYGSLSDNSLDAVKHGTHQMTRKTTCPMGHPYSEENTIHRKSKNCRDCAACRRMKIRLRSLYRAQNRQRKALMTSADLLDKYITASKTGAAA